MTWLMEQSIFSFLLCVILKQLVIGFFFHITFRVVHRQWFQFHHEQNLAVMNTSHFFCGSYEFFVTIKILNLPLKHWFQLFS